MDLPAYKQLFEARPTSPSSKSGTQNKEAACMLLVQGEQVTGFGAGIVDRDDGERAKHGRVHASHRG